MARSTHDIPLGYDPSGNPVCLPLNLLHRHAYICGKSGSGKSKLLEHTLRQLITRWPQTGEGLLLIDPHAELYQSLMAWMAAEGYDSFPVIPFDLRSDWICCLNILRPRPELETAPLITAAVRAILHGWKQSDGSRTPRLEKWLMTLLATLYHSRCTLLEALDIIRSRDIRTALARQVEDPMAKSVWIASSKLTEASFQEELESTMNRLGRFLATQVLRLAFSQSEVSLDMQQALNKGHIVLAAIATEGSRIAEEDAAVVGSLLVNEVWGAAKHRGKREGGQLHRRFIVAIDEFQEYVSPVIAQSLAQLRGMNVGFLLAHQSPQQLLDLGQTGRQVLNAIISNATTQVFFQTAHPADLDLVVPWLYRGSVDVNQVKYQHYSTKVLGYKLEYHDSTHQQTTQGTTETKNWSDTRQVTRALARGETHTDAITVGHSTQHAETSGENLTLGQSQEHSQAESRADSTADGTTESQATARARQRTTGESEQRQLSGDYASMMRVVGAEPTATFDAAYVDKDEEHRALQRTVGKTASAGEGDTQSQTAALATTHSASTARAIQEANSHGQSLARGTNSATTDAETDSVSVVSSDSQTVTETLSTSKAKMRGGAHADQHSTAEGVTRSPMLMPVLGKEADTPVFRSPEEQLFVFSQFLSSQPDRHAVVRIDTAPPVPVTTPTVTPAKISATGAQAWANGRLKKLPFALPQEEAVRRLVERRKQFETKYLGAGTTGEPEHVVRRIKE